MTAAPEDDHMTSYVVLTSASMSAVGCTLVMLSFVCFPDLRGFGRRLILYLCIADFVVALTYIAGIRMKHEHGRASEDFCSLIGGIQTLFELASIAWSTLLAFTLLCIARSQFKFTWRHEMFFHAGAWGVPILYSVVLGIQFDAFGNAGEWCWIKSPNSTKADTTQSPDSKSTPEAIKVARVMFYVILITCVVFCFVSYLLSLAFLGRWKHIPDEDVCRRYRRQHQRVASTLMRFVVVSIISYGVALAARTAEFFYAGRWDGVPHELRVTASFFSPLQGFLNMVCYTLNDQLITRYVQLCSSCLCRWSNRELSEPLITGTLTSDPLRENLDGALTPHQP